MSTVHAYTDQLRHTMEQCGLSVSPVVRRDDKPCLRFDAVEITEQGITFLWLGKPVYMSRKHQGNLVHVMGEMVLEMH